MGFICTLGNRIQLINESAETKLSLNVLYNGGEDEEFELDEFEAQELTNIVEDHAMETYKDVTDAFPEIEGLVITIRKIS